MKRITRFASTLALLTAALVSFSPPVHADKLEFDQLWFRTTVAASNVALPQWTVPLNDGGAYADSSVWRRGATTRTVIDTTMAYPVDKWRMPPTYPNHLAGGYAKQTKQSGSAGSILGYGDSVAVDTLDRTPWIVIRARQDTTSYAFTGGTSLDSLYIGAQFSADGKNWNSVGGTPTIAHSTTFIAAGEDGLSPPALAFAEAGVPEQVVGTLPCFPSIYTGGALIINRTACMTGGYLRFIVSAGAGTGQWKLEVGNWKPQP